MLNSHALTVAITPFNPKGDFGERHIHALPYRLMPAFDSSNEDHVRIAVLARHVAAQARSAVDDDAYLGNPEKSLSVRRRKLRARLVGLADVQELEQLCAAALGTTVADDEALQGGEQG